MQMNKIIGVSKHLRVNKCNSCLDAGINSFTFQHFFLSIALQ